MATCSAQAASYFRKEDIVGNFEIPLNTSSKNDTLICKLILILF